MRTVKFQDVLHWIGEKMLGDPARMRREEAAGFVRHINVFVREGWERDAWPEWTPCEERHYAPTYDPAADYPAGAIVWDPATAAYYRHAAATVGTVAGNEGSTIFATGPVTVADGDTLSIGGVIFTVVSSYENTINVAGRLDDNAVPGGLPILDLDAGAPGGPGWTPLANTDWERTVSLDQSGATPIGTVLSVSPRHPLTSPGTPHWKFLLSPNGIEIPAEAGNSVWIRFRKRPPTFTSDPYRADGEYATAALVYFLSDGEVYQRTSTGEPLTGTDPTDATHWTRVPFPYVLANYVRRAAYGEALDSDGQADKALLQGDKAEEQLAIEWGKSEGQQDQVRTYAVATRSAPIARHAVRRF